jgi:hypothetical protein
MAIIRRSDGPKNVVNEAEVKKDTFVNSLDELAEFAKSFITGETAGDIGIDQEELTNIVSPEFTKDAVNRALDWTPAGISKVAPKLAKGVVSGRNIKNVADSFGKGSIREKGYGRYLDKNTRTEELLGLDKITDKKRVPTPEKIYDVNLPIDKSMIDDFRALKELANLYGGYDAIGRKLRIGNDATVADPTLLLKNIGKNQKVYQDFVNLKKRLPVDSIQNKQALEAVVDVKNKTGKTINPLYFNRTIDKTRPGSQANKESFIEKLFSGVKDLAKTKGYYSDKIENFNELYKHLDEKINVDDLYTGVKSHEDEFLNLASTRKALIDDLTRAKTKEAFAPTTTTAIIESLGLGALGSLAHPLAGFLSASMPVLTRIIDKSKNRSDIANEIYRLAGKYGIPDDIIKPYLRDVTNVDKLIDFIQRNGVVNRVANRAGDISTEKSSPETNKELNRLLGR